MRILLIEDDHRLADLLAKRLLSEGHDAEACGSGVDGFDRAVAGGFDLLVVDVMLPGMDGISLTRELRARRMTLPVLMLTARDSVHDRVEGLRTTTW